MKTVVRQVILLLLMRMKRVMLQVILLQLLVASSTIELPCHEVCGVAHVDSSSFCSIVSCMYRWKEQRSSTTFSPWWCSVGLCNNADRVAGKFVTTFERQHLWRGQHHTHTNGPSNSNTVSNLGLASFLTKDVRVHGSWSEFLNKFPDRSNMTFEETDGGLDRSHESLGAAFKTRQRRETHS